MRSPGTLLRISPLALLALPACGDCETVWRTIAVEAWDDPPETLRVLGDGLILGRGETILAFELADTGGYTFSAHSLDTEDVPLGLYSRFTRGKTAVIVGTNGLIRISPDRSGTWSAPVLQPGPPAGASLRAVDFGCALDGNQSADGIAVGDDVVLRTADHGSTWTVVPLGLGHALAAVKVMNDGVALAAGDNVILRTTDDGATWAPVHATSEPADRLSWIVSRRCDIPYAGDDGPNVMVAGGDLAGGILVSGDLGVSWHPVPGPPDRSLSSFLVTGETASELEFARGIAGDELWEYARDDTPTWRQTHRFERPIRGVLWPHDLFLDDEGSLIQPGSAGPCHPR